MIAGVDIAVFFKTIALAFRRDELAQALRFGLGRNLDHIVPPGDMQSTVYELVEVAEREGWLIKLIETLAKQRPNDTALQVLLRRIRPDATVGPESGSEERLNAGVVHQQAKEYDQASAAFQRAADLARAERNARNEARALTLLGETHRRQGHVRDATHQYEQALVVSRSAGDLELVFDALRVLAGLSQDAGEPTRAVVLFEELLGLTRTLGRGIDEAATLQTIGRLRSQTGAFDVAVNDLQAAADCWARLGDLAGRSSAISELASVYQRAGDLPRAETAYQEALSISRQTGSRAVEADVLANLGQLAFLKADYAEASAWFQRALALSQQLSNDPSIAANLANLGRVAMARGEWNEAVANYRGALAVVERLGDLRATAAALGNLGTALWEVEDPSEVQAVLSRALEMFLSLGDSAGITRTEEQLAAIRARKEARERSLFELVRDAQRFFKSAGFRLNTTQNPHTFLCEPAPPMWSTKIGTPVFTAVELGRPLGSERVIAVRDEARRAGAAIRNAFVLVDHPVDVSGWLQIATLRAEHFRVMPVPRTLVYDGRVPAPARWEQTTLSSHLSRFLGEGQDPFDVRDPVFDVLNFFGREVQAEGIRDRLRRGQPVGLFGLRKMGKSSLMRFLERRLPYPTAWLDLQAGRKLVGVYERILRAWQADAQARFNTDLGLDPARCGAADPSEEFTRQAVLALEVIAEVMAEPRLAVFLDEIEVIVPPASSTGPDLEEYLALMRTLRGLAQEDQRLSLMVAGVSPAVNRESRCGADRVQNPFYALLQEEFIPPLSPADCAQMIRNVGQQVDVTLGDEVAEYVAEQSGGHPMLARQLCSLAYRLRDRAAGELPLAAIRDAADRFVSDPEYYTHLGRNGLWMETTDERLWGGAGAAANQAILRVLAESPEPVHEAVLLTGVSAPDRRTALLELTRRSVLTRDPSGPAYRITFELFRSWIRRNLLGQEV